MAFVLRGVEITSCFCDESLIADPKLVAADANFVSGSARSAVCADKVQMAKFVTAVRWFEKAY